MLAAAADSVAVPRNGSCVGEGEGEGGWSFSQCGRGKIYEAGDHRSREPLLLSLLLPSIAFFEHKRQQRARKGQKRKMVQLDLFRLLSVQRNLGRSSFSPCKSLCSSSTPANPRAGNSISPAPLSSLKHAIAYAVKYGRNTEEYAPFSC